MTSKTKRITKSRKPSTFGWRSNLLKLIASDADEAGNQFFDELNEWLSTQQTTAWLSGDPLRAAVEKEAIYWLASAPLDAQSVGELCERILVCVSLLRDDGAEAVSNAIGDHMRHEAEAATRLRRLAIAEVRS